MEFPSTTPNIPDEEFRQYETNCREFADKFKQYKQRIKKLVAIQPATSEEASPELAELDTISQETSLLPQTSPDDIDTFSHFRQNCPTRRNSKRYIAFFEPVKKCTQCYDHSSTRPLEYWQPDKHKDYLRKFPDKVKKEMKDREYIRSRLTDASVRQKHGVGVKGDDQFIMSDESTGEDEVERQQEEVDEVNDEIERVGEIECNIESESESEVQSDVNTKIDSVDDEETKDSEARLSHQPALQIHHPQPRQPRASIVIPDSSPDSRSPPLQMTRPQSSQDRVVIEISDDEDEDMTDDPRDHVQAPQQVAKQEVAGNVSGVDDSDHADTNSSTDLRNVFASSLPRSNSTPQLHSPNNILVGMRSVRRLSDLALSTRIISSESISYRASGTHTGRMIKANHEAVMRQIAERAFD